MTAICEKTGLNRAEWIEALRAAVESDDGEVCPDAVFIADWNTNLLAVRRRIEAVGQAEEARQALADMPPEPVMPGLDDVIGPATTFRTVLELVQTSLVPGGVPRTKEAWHYRQKELERRRLTAMSYLQSTTDPAAWGESGRLSNEVFAERKGREQRQQAFTAARKLSAEIESGTIEKRYGESADTPAERRALRTKRLVEARGLFKAAGASTEEELAVLFAQSVQRESELQARMQEAGRRALLDPYALKLRGLG